MKYPVRDDKYLLLIFTLLKELGDETWFLLLPRCTFTFVADLVQGVDEADGCVQLKCLRDEFSLRFLITNRFAHFKEVVQIPQSRKLIM